MAEYIPCTSSVPPRPRSLFFPFLCFFTQSAEIVSGFVSARGREHALSLAYSVHCPGHQESKRGKERTRMLLQRKTGDSGTLSTGHQKVPIQGGTWAVVMWHHKKEFGDCPKTTSEGAASALLLWPGRAGNVPNTPTGLGSIHFHAGTLSGSATSSLLCLNIYSRS